MKHMHRLDYKKNMQAHFFQMIERKDYLIKFALTAALDVSSVSIGNAEKNAHDVIRQLPMLVSKYTSKRRYELALFIPLLD